jgi:hypothetical protein
MVVLIHFVLLISLSLLSWLISLSLLIDSLMFMTILNYVNVIFLGIQSKEKHRPVFRLCVG